MRMYELTPEGRVISALMGRERSFAELLRETGLSSRWLTLKLKELTKLGAVTRDADKRYRLEYSKLREVVSGGLKTVTKLIALEMAKDRSVLAVILFGSLAKGIEGDESDVDLLIITKRGAYLNELILKLMVKFDLQIEAIVVSFKEFLNAIRIQPPLLFGILEGYNILFDKVGIGGVLKIVEEEIREDWFYDEEVDVWVRRALRPLWRALGST